MIRSERLLPCQEPSIERRYYISSLPACTLKIGNTIRKHGGIENQAHWILDVVFREDEQNTNAGNIIESVETGKKH